MAKKKSIYLPNVSKGLLAFLKTEIEYLPGETAYNDPKIFKEFIGGEVQINADLGRQIVGRLGFKETDSLFFLETCCGPGTMIKDLHLDFPQSKSIGIDISESMCDLGRSENPHVTFIRANIVDPKFVLSLRKTMRKSNPRFRTFDVALNSPASLGFFSPEELEKHLSAMNDLLSVKGSYYAEIGYYASVIAASVNNHLKMPGSFRGEKTIDWTVTTKYFPRTDFHEISWSAWSLKTKKLLFAMTHKNRALRPSELALMAKRVGLEFRIWRLIQDPPNHISFLALDENSSYQFERGFHILVEFHRPDAPRLDARGTNC